MLLDAPGVPMDALEHHWAPPGRFQALPKDPEAAPGPTQSRWPPKMLPYHTVCTWQPQSRKDAREECKVDAWGGGVRASVWNPPPHAPQEHGGKGV